MIRPLKSCCPLRWSPLYWNDCAIAALAVLPDRDWDNADITFCPPATELTTSSARPIAESQFRLRFWVLVFVSWYVAEGIVLLVNDSLSAGGSVMCLWVRQAILKSSARVFNKSTAKITTSLILSSFCVNIRGIGKYVGSARHFQSAFE